MNLGKEMLDLALSTPYLKHPCHGQEEMASDKEKRQKQSLHLEMLMAVKNGTPLTLISPSEDGKEAAMRCTRKAKKNNRLGPH